MLKALAASIVVSAGLSLGVAPAAHAQVKNKQHHQTKAAKTTINVTVNKGDTLSAIAKSHTTTYQRLYDANTEINDPDMIFPGQKLRIPDPSEQLAHRDIPANVVTAPVAQPQSRPAAATQAAASYQPVVSAPVAVAPEVPAAPIAGCGDNSYANFIYSHESGCRTTAMSSNGCYGIGQACPASKIAYCGADYACQNAYFTTYAGKYGGWAGAYAFWTSHGWW